ncbi:hypothetical protein LTR86_001344 [Recurvomyces mirabilis]|nr:hypothetical protein LTR86_001344 [Recurvomyces mirabilis]
MALRSSLDVAVNHETVIVQEMFTSLLAQSMLPPALQHGIQQIIYHGLLPFFKMADHRSEHDFEALLEQYYASIPHKERSAAFVVIPQATAEPKHGEVEEPPRKKRRMKRVECDICSNMVAVNQFPKIAHHDTIEHAGKVCCKCWEQHLHSEVENKPWDHVSCPQCDNVLVEQEIRRLASSATTQVYRYCIICEARMHEDETCNGYQERVKTERDRQERAEENKRSEAEVEKISKPCPSCGRHLDKYTGCDHVTCMFKNPSDLNIANLLQVAAASMSSVGYVSLRTRAQMVSAATLETQHIRWSAGTILQSYLATRDDVGCQDNVLIVGWSGLTSLLYATVNRSSRSDVTELHEPQ